MNTVLQIKDVRSWYGDFQALFGISLSLKEGEALALIGANGAGKSTLLRTICRAHEGKWEGLVSLENASLALRDAAEAARRGLILVPEGRQLFPSLSVMENLEIGRATGREGPWSIDQVLHLFPDLARLLDRPATLLSGGQQQMVAIGRALMGNPKVLLCDEISLGLAPVVIGQMYEALKQIRATGMSLIIVEQSIQQAISVSDNVLCLRGGQITYSSRSDAADTNAIEAAYFGMESAR